MFHLILISVCQRLKHSHRKKSLIIHFKMSLACITYTQNHFQDNLIKAYRFNLLVFLSSALKCFLQSFLCQKYINKSYRTTWKQELQNSSNFLSHCTENRNNLSILKIESVIIIIQSICKVALITQKSKIIFIIQYNSFNFFKISQGILYFLKNCESSFFLKKNKF